MLVQSLQIYSALCLIFICFINFSECQECQSLIKILLRKRISYSSNTMNIIKEKSPNKEEAYYSNLRTSTEFMNLMMLRSTLANSSYTTKLRNVNESCYYGKRLSNLHSINKAVVDKDREMSKNQATYIKLKDTLQNLQNKISKAQRILSSPYKKPIKSNHNLELQIEITLSDMDQRTTKKNQDSAKFMNNQQKISEISKNSSIMTTYKANKSCSFAPRLNKQYYISSLISMNSSTADPRVKQHMKLNFDVIKKLGNWQAPDHKELSSYKVILPPNKAQKKTLLLDIDDTILNCDDTKNEDSIYDFELPIQDQDGSEFVVYIKLRPYALTFLKNVAKVYEIVAYTGSIENYAKKVIQQIDPEGEIFAYQLYRNSCFEIFNGVYVKDIRIVNRRPENIVLVDNSPYSYIYQLQNGIPILPYDKGPDDELPKLQKYLLTLSQCKDIREVNKQTFQFHRYQEFNSVNEVISGLYMGTKM